MHVSYGIGQKNFCQECIYSIIETLVCFIASVEELRRKALGNEEVCHPSILDYVCVAEYVLLFLLSFNLVSRIVTSL